jgi:hypothetical protein
MKHNKNAEQGAVANPHGAFSSEFSPNYNLNTFVNHRSLRGVSYARTLGKESNGNRWRKDR